MDYAGALNDLASRIPHGTVPDLDRIGGVCRLMADPQLSYPSIQITGTNGKTSVARMLTTLFASVGLSAGTFTSPHLQDVRERLTVAGRPISEEDLARAYGEILPYLRVVDGDEATAGRVTYFEALTALAYAWFADVPVDVGIFEVGMGGTWDATNLARGEVAVLTTIDRDHPELGSTPAEVAREKVGIIKEGAGVVTAEQPPEVMEVVRRAAAERGARLLVAGEDFRVVGRRVAVGGQVLTVATPHRTLRDLELPLHGAHQAGNAALALTAFEEFLGEAAHPVQDGVAREALAVVRVPGRLETVHRDPTVLLDGAHNPHGATATAAAVREAFAFRNLILVAACLADKDVTGILAPFRDVADHVVVTRAPTPRGAPEEAMARAAREVFEGTAVIVESAPDVAGALELATGVAGEADGVLVTGSLYAVGAAREVYRPFAEEEGVRARG